MPLAGLHTGAEALQGSVYAGGAHAKAHRREATQVHGELAGTHGASHLACGTPGWGGHRNVIADVGTASGRALPVSHWQQLRANPALCVWATGTCRLDPGDRTRGQ